MEGIKMFILFIHYTNQNILLRNSPGTAPVYVAPPIMATGNLPLVVPSPAPLVQPFQAVRPIMVPAASSMVPGKYM